MKVKKVKVRRTRSPIDTPPQYTQTQIIYIFVEYLCVCVCVRLSVCIAHQARFVLTDVDGKTVSSFKDIPVAAVQDRLYILAARFHSSTAWPSR